IHTSNRDWKLAPVVADVAQALGLECRVLRDNANAEKDATHFSSEWVVIARKAEYLAHTKPPKSEKYDIDWQTPAATGKHLWTDAGPHSLEPLRWQRHVQLPLRSQGKEGEDR